MIKKWSIRIVVAILSIVVILFYTAPAKLIQSNLNDESEQLTISQATGHLSSGEFHHININGQSIDQLNWDLALSKLILGKFAGSLEIIDPKIDGHLNFAQQLNGQMQLSEINLVQSVPDLAEIQPKLKLISPDGEVTWKDVAISFDDTQFYSASGDIIWSNATVEINRQFMEFGNITVNPTVDNTDLVLLIKSDSTLDIVGSLRLKMNQQYEIEFSLQSDLPAAIKQSVLYVTQLGDDGRFHFKMSGNL